MFRRSDLTVKIVVLRQRKEQREKQARKKHARKTRMIHCFAATRLGTLLRAWIGAAFLAVSAESAPAKAPQADSTAWSSYWGVGVVGSAGIQFPTSPLAAVQGYEAFPAALGEYAGLWAEAGVEAHYRLSPLWEFSLQAGYGALSATAAGDETITINALAPGTNRLQTIRATLRNRVAANIDILAFSPFVRAYVGEYFFLGAGARFDVPFQPRFRYNAELSPLAPGIFVQNFMRQIDAELPEQSAARGGLSWSPLLAVGGLFPLGERARLRAEVQVQPLFQAFRGFTADRAEWNLPTARLQLALLWITPTRSERVLPDNAKNEAQQLTSSDAAEQALLPQPSPTPQTVVQVFTQATDTVFQRDTATRLVAWSEQESIRLESREEELRTAPTGAQTAHVRERYARLLPKPKPFLVASLEALFVPAPGAPASAARRKLAELVEKKTIIRILEASPRAGSPQKQARERFDTIRIVRMPIVRFTPSASGENSVKEKILYIRSDASAHSLAQIPVGEADHIDWDAQSLLFSAMRRPKTDDAQKQERDEEQELEQELETTSVAFAWLEAFDNALQKAVSDTARITFERSEGKARSGDTPSQTIFQTNAQTSPQAGGRWTLAELPLALSDGAENENVSFAWSESAKPVAEALAHQYGSGGKSSAIPASSAAARANALLRSRVVFAVIPAHSSAAKAEAVRHFTRNFAATLKAAWHIVLLTNDNNAPATVSPELSFKTAQRLDAPAYIRVMIEE
jgi:hypothetical protein